MNSILFDDCRSDLLPLTYTKPVCQLRVGILTIKEKWEILSGLSFSFKTEDYLQKKYPLVLSNDNLFINGSILPNKELVDAIEKLEREQSLVKDGVVIAYKSSNENRSEKDVEYQNDIFQLNRCWNIFSLNEAEIESDFQLVTKGKTTQEISKTNTVIGGQNIFIEEGAKVECSILNAQSGFIYLGKNAEIMEGSMVRGSLAMCENSVLKMGAKIYGATTLGPFCKVGGEVNNSVFQGFSNKGHDGFLGNSVIGEWCNLGADTNNSNLKNNYAEVKLWNYSVDRFEKTGLQFCGLIMGDHSKCGINTMFNTGTVIGISSNLFGPGFPRNFIPSFSWGGSGGYTTFVLDKVFDVAQKVMERRAIELTSEDKDILNYVFSLTNKYRKQ
jgi:UDP-N-acetylglucosamine diphosphorylase/glucosamine-1-phosphate N-acetyltransferase